jgi:uncharacterized SAM-binding protein YcdF (DUF218 family)
MAAMEIERWARLVWDYHHVGHALAKADAILVLGSHDTRVAERAAQLFLEGWAPVIVFSGHLGALTKERWSRSEAEIFADVAASRGVPRERMLIEDRSTNTGENVEFSRRLLSEHGLAVSRAIAVQKPYMERRTLATFHARWPELDVIVSSPQIDWRDYPNERITRDDVIHIMVGDLQRLMLYAQKGWSEPQDIPPDVVEAYQRLVKAGYTRRLIESA